MNNSKIHNVFNEEFFLAIGSTWTLDSLYLFFLTPMSFADLLLNVMSFIVLTRIKTNLTMLYKYLRIYTLNSCILTFLYLFITFGLSPRYFSFTVSVPVRIYRCIVINYFTSLFYFFGNVFDIFIAIERLSLFFRKLKRFVTISPYKIALAIFLTCALINLPVYFWYDVPDDETFLKQASNMSVQFSICNNTGFLKTKYGLILSLIAIALRDVVTLIAEIIANGLTLFYLNNFIKKKSALTTGNVHIEPNPANQTANTTEAVAAASSTQEPAIAAIKRDEREKNAEKVDMTLQKQKKNQNETTKRNLAMIFTLSSLSIISHAGVLILFIWHIAAFLNEKNVAGAYFNFMTFFLVQCKHIMNFFVFYKFNLNFKKNFKLC